MTPLRRRDGLKPAPEIDTIPYWEYMNSFPAIEIAYLAVEECFQGKGIGSFILEEIMKYVSCLPDQKYDFVTVRAYNTDEYSAIPFYQKCGFTEAAKQVANTNLFMYRVVQH